MTAPALGSWRNPPLAYVVAELGISPHYGLKAAIAAVQQSVREHYPKTVEATELVIDPQSTPQTQPIWRLLSADQSQGIQIGTRSISLHVTSYSDSADFLHRWREVLSAVESAKLGAFVERAGLRYIDLIVPSEGHEPKDYLISELHGLAHPEGGLTEANLWAAVYSVNGCRVQAKTASPAPRGMVLPPDFSALPLQKPKIWIDAEQCMQANKHIGFIDTDCLKDVQALFNAEELGIIFTNLRGYISSTFQSLMSPLAKKEWM